MQCTYTQASIIGLTSMSSVHIRHLKDVKTLWRYLNLLHAAAFCGLTPSLNKANFFQGFVNMYELLPLEVSFCCRFVVVVVVVAPLL